MENAKKGNQKHAAEEKAELIAAYRRSGLSQKRWCTEQGVALSTLGNWLKADKIRTEQQNSPVRKKVLEAPLVQHQTQGHEDTTTAPLVHQNPQEQEKVAKVPPVQHQAQVHANTSTLLVQHETQQIWTKVSVKPPVREQLLLLQAGKFKIEINQNTDMQLLSELLSVLVSLC